jgi:hypothetical protein
MARGKSKPKKGANARPQPAAPQSIYEATLGANGGVIRVQPPINQAQARPALNGYTSFERRRPMNDEMRELVEQPNEEQASRAVVDSECERALLEQIHRQAIAQGLVQPLPQLEPFTELPEDTSDGPIAGEWNFYRCEVGRLLAAGHEGRWVLIKGDEIVGIWNTEEEAERIRLQKYLMQPILLKQICVREPILRGGGYHRRWRS